MRSRLPPTPTIRPASQRTKRVGKASKLAHMSYFIKKGTRVTVRRPNAKPTDWFSYQTQKDLRLGEPLSIERGSYLFDYQNWRIRIRKNLLERVSNAKPA
ncbi:hypothetical protein Mal15_62560 [Stieleria maiorica]|uniref:Uncharacterized protein n=1 Tax=Stieleria maiorica TaxID=2795974 RepID=A0A5B9MPU1_9BACT|nr:hypothetical protein [Stieleria maiorica]QEG02171.1 hypothetical protein Mal15_62560 [Stieleria maiorica]